MPSITFNYSSRAGARFQEANDYLNSLPSSLALTARQRLARVLNAWVRETLVTKQKDQDNLDQQAISAAVAADMDIT